MTAYKYDLAMINEIELLMENCEPFYFEIQAVKRIYQSDDIGNAIITHAAIQAFDTFYEYWRVRETPLLGIPEYCIACSKVIPELWETID